MRAVSMASSAHSFPLSWNSTNSVGWSRTRKLDFSLVEHAYLYAGLNTPTNKQKKKKNKHDLPLFVFIIQIFTLFLKRHLSFCIDKLTIIHMIFHIIFLFCCAIFLSSTQRDHSMFTLFDETKWFIFQSTSTTFK